MRHETSKTAATVCRTRWKAQRNVLFCTPLRDILVSHPCGCGNGEMMSVPVGPGIVSPVRMWKRVDEMLNQVNRYFPVSELNTSLSKIAS